MKASVVQKAITNIDNVEQIILTSTSSHYASRITNPVVDVANETLTYTDAITKHVYVVDCNDVNMIVYKPGTTL